MEELIRKFFFYPWYAHKSKLFTIVYFSIEIALLMFLAVRGVTCYRNTLLPFCFDAFYYELFLFIIPGIVVLFHWIIKRKVSFITYGNYLLLTSLLAITISTVFTINCISSNNLKLQKGRVIETGKLIYSKSPTADSNAVKIQLIGTGITFCYNIQHQNIPLNTTCDISIAKGVLGLNYVVDVDFE